MEVAMSRVFSAASLGVAITLLSLGSTGCSDHPPASPLATAERPASPPTKPAEVDEVGAARKKLSAEDRILVDAQEWCVVMTDERLGSMGPPVKLTIKGEPVFVCCKGCKKTAEANPDETLAKLKELKVKAKSGNVASR
jgi:hypothetical protein